MKRMADSGKRGVVDGKPGAKKLAEPWNDPHLGVAAEVYRRLRPAPGAVDVGEPWNDPKLGAVAEVYGWCRKR
jgi:hypothetical protein